MSRVDVWYHHKKEFQRAFWHYADFGDCDRSVREAQLRL